MNMMPISYFKEIASISFTLPEIKHSTFGHPV